MEMISLDPAPQQSQYSLDTTNPSINDTAAQSRAAKADIGLGMTTNQTYDGIYRQISGGQEDTFRAGAASVLDSKSQNLREQALQKTAATKGSELSLKEVQDILLSKPTNPDTVVEQTYAHTYVNTLQDAAKRIEDNVLTKAQEDDPAAVEKYFSAGSDHLASREYYISQAQNLQQQVDADSWFSIPTGSKEPGKESVAFGSKNSPWWTAANWASLGIIGGLREDWVMRGNTPATSRLAGIFEGNNVAAQAAELARLPTLADRKAVFDKALDRLKAEDPALAQQWAMAMAGQSSNEMLMRDVTTAANIGTGIGGFQGLRGIRNLGRDYKAGAGVFTPPKDMGGLVQGSDGVYRPPGGGGGALVPVDSQALQQAQKAVEDVLRTSPAVPTKAGMAEAAGDTKEAAVQKTITSVAKNNPSTDATDTLFDLHKTNQENVRANPGNNSREEHTRLLDAGETFEKNTVDVIKNTTQLVRLPALAEEGFRDVADRASGFFRGKENTIVNIDMVHDPFVPSNNEWHVYTIGDYTGRPFARLEDAQHHITINNYGKAQTVGTNPDIVYIPKAAVLENKNVESFKTAKGSTYEIQQDGTTIRNKAFDDKGLKDRSEHTGYITPEEYKAIQKAAPTGNYAEHLQDGKLRLFTDVKNGVHIVARDEPAVGLIPVESLPGNKIHYGHEITEMMTHADKIVPRSNFVHEATEEKIKGLTKQQTENVIKMSEQQLVRFDNTIKDSKKHPRSYLPDTIEEYKKQADQLRKGIAEYKERLNNFTGKKQWSFYLDDPKGTRSEVMPQVDPEPTHLPFDLRTGKFGQPLSIGPHIVQKGLGFHIKFFIPLNEQDNFLRENHLIKTDRTRSASSTDSFANGMLGYLRLPQDTLSAAENDNRFKLVYGQNRYINLIRDEMKAVNKILNKGSTDPQRKDFERALAASQKMLDPDKNSPSYGLPGYYMKTPAEIQHFWNTAFSRPPTEGEQAAYLAVGRMGYADWVFRNLAVYKNKARLGVMEHVLLTTKDGQTIRSAPFEGRSISKFPEGNIPVLIQERDGTVKYYNAQNVESKKRYRERAKTGEIKGVQLYNPDTYDVKVFDRDNNPVRVVYIFSDTIESSPISTKQVGFRGGGHWDYNYDHWVKQPIIRRFDVGGKTHWVHEGDATFAPVRSRVDGETFVAKLNEIKNLLSKKKIVEAKAVHQGYSDQPWKDFVRGFYPSKDRVTKQIKPSRFNFHEDFRVVPKGFTISEYDKNLLKKYEGMKGKFVDAAKGEQSLARNFQVEFTGARDSHDLFEPHNIGTIQNPLYKFQPAELTDPIVALQRGLRRIIESTMADDYKYSAVEHWLQENMDMLSGRPDEIRGSPFYSFMHGDLNRRFKNTLRGQTAESNRYKIRKLIGMPTAIDSQIQMAKQYLADQIYSTDSKIKKTFLVPAEWTLAHTTSPTNFVRGMAFHQNLGFFNWVQLAAQHTAYLNFAALSPMHAIPGTFGAWMHLWSRINGAEPILKQLGKMSETFGWKPGEWQQAMTAYDRSGFGHIGNTLAIHDPEQKFVIGKVKGLLQKGTILFDLAEQNVRHGAWYTAWHEFVRAFPNKKIDSVDIGKIGSRANDLYMNMGRDSKTFLSTGVGSMALQFYKYTENVAQMMFSKRIGNSFQAEKLVKGEDGTFRPKDRNTWQYRARQRAQMILLYSLFFGPVGALGLSGVSLGNYYARKYALENSYVPGENATSSLLLEGPVAVAGAYASGWWRTGKLDMQEGTMYNFNNRYGANGVQLFQDLLQDSPAMWKILLGAGGTTLANNLSSISPFVYAMKAAWNDEQDNPFPLTWSDWKDGLNNINTMRYIDRLQYALAYQKWIDRHGQSITDISASDAIFRTLLGVNDVNIDDGYIKAQISSHEKSDYHKAEQEYQHYRRLAEQAAVNGDPDQAIAMNKKALFIAHSSGAPDEEVSKWFKSDATMNKNTLDKTNDSFYKRLVPNWRKPAADKAYQNIK